MGDVFPARGRDAVPSKRRVQNGDPPHRNGVARSSSDASAQSRVASAMLRRAFLVLSATERPHWRKFGSFEKTLDDRLGVTKFLLLKGSHAPQRSREQGRYQKADILIVKTPRS